MKEEELLLTTGDAAKQLHCVSYTVILAADAGQLPVYARTLRGQRLFRLVDVLAFGKQRVRKEGSGSLKVKA